MRRKIVLSVSLLVEQGELDWDDCRGNTLSVKEWQSRMLESCEWVDHIFMVAAAKMFKRDIVMLPTFPRSGWPGDGSLRCIRGGPRMHPEELDGPNPLGVDSPAPGPPFLLGVIEAGTYCNEHYQVYLLSLCHPT